MHRIDAAGFAAGNLFTDGNPSTGTSATVVDAAWLNDMQENIAQVVEGAGISLSKGDYAQLKSAIQLLISGSAVPAGSVIFAAKSSAPTGYLKANGAAVSRATYAALFSVIGTTFGAGDGSTTFNVPDLRAEFIRGLDDGRSIDVGRTLGSAQMDSFQGHWHNSYYSAGQTVGSGGNTYAEHVTGGNNAGPIADIVRAPISDGTNGTPRTSTETRPRNVALLACIKY